MMINTLVLTRRFEHVFDKRQAFVLAKSITEAYSDLVKTSDFNELKSIVQDLAIAQQKLAIAQQKLTVSQQEMAVSQQEMAVSQQEMNINVSKMAQTISGMGNELGGLSRTMSYALENEAFRVLPAYLKKHFDIIVQSRFVRTEIGGEEIDFYAHGEQNGSLVCIIGESKLKIDERRHSGKEFRRIMNQLDRKVTAVQEDQPDCRIVRMLVTHYVRPSARQLLEDEGVLVVQSFDWE